MARTRQKFGPGGADSSPSTMQYIIGSIKPIDKETHHEREREFAQRYRNTNDHTALQEIVEMNRAMAVNIALSYRGLGIADEDLIGEATVGLIEAARIYDPGRGANFITHAMWYVRKAVLQALAKISRTVRIPSYQYKKVLTLVRAMRQLRQILQREPTREELSSYTGAKEAVIADVLGNPALRQAVSTDEPIGNDESGDHVQDRIADPRIRPFLEILELREQLLLVEQAMEVLSVRERKVLRYTFGFEGRILTLRQIGKRIGTSGENARLVRNRALRKLRNRIRRNEFARNGQNNGR
ncbi:MAG: hypothetical protein A3B30_03665 [Candidatus Komeilibacteria bacterium RIFCSPLOWO2_01_FULL_52_15]|uniref:RNA polymerase sigma-70 domain-containing protein n=2 Tax=Candidatus Komeiliibacteriota TaxID=1817908 RepID=A0A1G2BN07_9BACT|nr:MAG: hypothetical protein A3B30_03665 [Candidatus Komeilibacteria bacterium RIFCSPLOWO2_01_FULL_52_15]OGY90575.1 MAG: hypothetical protein A2677_00775 [Candidatus Komeilibacteria bacterium RIFCSPHIGHO2_01_FULL_52_14]